MENNDPWVHRSAGMKCKTCMWFAAKVPFPNAQQMNMVPIVDMGRCRRHAPTMNGYPVVFVNDWCGDHKVDENKIQQDRGTSIPSILFEELVKKPGDIKEKY